MERILHGELFTTIWRIKRVNHCIRTARWCCCYCCFHIVSNFVVNVLRYGRTTLCNDCTEWGMSPFELLFFSVILYFACIRLFFHILFFISLPLAPLSMAFSSFSLQWNDFLREIETCIFLKRCHGWKFMTCDTQLMNTIIFMRCMQFKQWKQPPPVDDYFVYFAQKN